MPVEGSKKPVSTLLVLIAFVIVATDVQLAQANPGSERTTMAGKRTGLARLPLADGEVEDIDMANKYVILKHGHIANLHMEPMTMAFAVKDTRLLAKVKVGDKVKFTAQHVGEVPTIMSLRVRK